MKNVIKNLNTNRKENVEMKEVKMKYWEDMSEEEKSEVCRNSGCPYFFGEIDDCMCDEVERSPYDADEKPCHWLKRCNRITNNVEMKEVNEMRKLTKYEVEALRYAWENFTHKYGFEESIEEAIKWAPTRIATILTYLTTEITIEDIILNHMRDFLETKEFNNVYTTNNRELTLTEKDALEFAQSVKVSRRVFLEDAIQWIVITGNSSEAIILEELLNEFTYEELEEYLLNK